MSLFDVFLAVGGLAGLVLLFVAVIHQGQRLAYLTTTALELKDAAADCLEREHDLKLELVDVYRRIARLEKNVGIVFPRTPIVGIIVADAQGIIRSYDPALTALLGWSAKDVLEKPVSVLIPPDTVGRHEEGYKLFVDSKGTRDPDHVIISEALSKDGKKVPVAITRRGWFATAGEIMVTATIRERIAT